VSLGKRKAKPKCNIYMFSVVTGIMQVTVADAYRHSVWQV